MSSPPRDPFAERLADDGQTLRRARLATLQLNLGKLCNQACHHCHVEAGPQRDEVMSWQTMVEILAWLDAHRGVLELATVDVTGGAPEMNPYFRRLVAALTGRGLHVLDRCNLTILLETDRGDLVSFLARHRVEIVASLPCYLAQNVDAQRGRGVFERSLEALRRLNAAGYGVAGSPLRLDLVYNPAGLSLPPDQQQLEDDYRRQLASRYGIEFHRLWTVTNMPIKRFAAELHRHDEYEAYLAHLAAAHRQANVEHVMCRDLVSVGWRGSVYDCDFHQMLGMPLEPGDLAAGADEEEVERRSAKLWDFTPEELIGHPIRTGAHCFGCTAGAGSSCTGALGAG